MEHALHRHDYGPEFERVNKILMYKDGRLIIVATDNRILDTKMYEVEYSDGYKIVMTVNEVANNLFSQVYQDGQRLLLFNAIIYLSSEGTHIREGDYFIYMSNGNKMRI